MSNLERVGVSLEKDLLKDFDELISRQGYTNRSEALRDLIRSQLSDDKLAQPNAQAVAGIFLIYDHHSTQLTEKLTQLQHNHLIHVIAATHVHLDHHHCLEVIMMKGQVDQLESLANNIKSLKGVMLSKLNLMSIASGNHD